MQSDKLVCNTCKFFMACNKCHDTCNKFVRKYSYGCCIKEYSCSKYTGVIKVCVKLCNDYTISKLNTITKRCEICTEFSSCEDCKEGKECCPDYNMLVREGYGCCAYKACNKKDVCNNFNWWEEN